MIALTADRAGLVGCLVGAALALHPASAHPQVAARPDAVPGITAGTMSPDIDLKTLAGGRVKLSQLRGHPVVITFWGTWCPPCRDEFPELAAAHRKYRDRGLEVVAVNQRDQELSERDVAAFVEEFAVEFTIALDPRGRSRRSYRLVALPTTVFVDAHGVIRTIHSGPIGPAQLAAGLASILPAE